MKKVFAILAIASAFAFASCGEKKNEEAATDSTAVVSEEPAAEAADSTMAGDSTKVDSAAAAPAEAEAKH